MLRGDNNMTTETIISIIASILTIAASLIGYYFNDLVFKSVILNSKYI